MPSTWNVLEPNTKRREKIQPVTVPLDTLPERRCPGQGSEGGKSRPLDHMRQIPFLGS